MGSVDDSDGHMGGILAHLQEIHFAACKKAEPDPETLAKRLFEWELRTEWDTFFDAAAKYARVLGTAQDVMRGRRTGGRHLNGYVSEQGRRVGVPTPCNDKVVELITRVPPGTLRPDPKNLDPLVAMLPKTG